ncbi:MAG: hypothetical protein QXJ18_01215 [Desulfurococcaceae archaeon]
MSIEKTEPSKRTKVVRSEKITLRVLKEVKDAYMSLTFEERRIVREILEKTILQMAENRPRGPREIKVDVRITTA